MIAYRAWDDGVPFTTAILGMVRDLCNMRQAEPGLRIGPQGFAPETIAEMNRQAP